PDEDVRSGPGLRFEAKQRELERQPCAMVGGEKRVDARHVRVHLLPGPLGCVLPRGPRRAPEADGPEEAVLRQSSGAEDLAQAAIADAALKLHLPQAILRVRVRESEVGFRLGRRTVVWDGV